MVSQGWSNTWLIESQMSKCPKESLELKKEMQSLLDVGKQKQVVTKKRRQAEHEACKEEVFRPTEVLSFDDDGGDWNVERARRESMRSYNEEEERRKMIFESASRGAQYELGGGSGWTGSGSVVVVVLVVCCVGCLVKNRPAGNPIFWKLINPPHKCLVDQRSWVQLTLLHIGLHLQSKLWVWEDRICKR